MRIALLIGTSWLALAAPARADGGDHFRAGIDAEGCYSCGGSYSGSSSTASDVDHEGGNLTDADRQMIAALTNGAWGTLVSIENGRAKYQDGNRTYFREIPAAPPTKPAPPRTAQRAVPQPVSRPPAPAYEPTTPAFDMGTISAPPLEGPAWSPPPEQASVVLEVPQPTAQISLPVRSAPRRPGYANLEPTLRARIHIDTRLPGAKLRRKGEETTAALTNAAIAFGYGAFFGAKPGGGKVFQPKSALGIIENGALVALAAEGRRRRAGGVTPFDADVRNALNYNDRQIRQLAREMEGNLSPHQVERFTAAFKKDRREYERNEREAARHDRREGRHE